MERNVLSLTTFEAHPEGKGPQRPLESVMKRAMDDMLDQTEGMGPVKRLFWALSCDRAARVLQAGGRPPVKVL